MEMFQEGSEEQVYQELLKERNNEELE